MAQKTNLGNNSSSTNADPLYITPMAITRQQIELESYSNPQNTREVL